MNEEKYSSWMIPHKPAILIETEEYGSTLVIADLHLGYIYGRNKKGIILPNAKRPETEVIELVKKIEPNRLLIVGDFKDEIFGSSNPLVGRIFDFLKKLHKLTRLTIIKGNHDGKIEELLPESVELIPVTGLRLKLTDGRSLGLWHGHATPALDVLNADVTISGHGHPSYSFRDEIGTKQNEKVWVKAKWLHNVGPKERLHIIMPAFNQYIEGFSIDGNFFKTIVAMKEAINFEQAEVFTLEGVLLGTISELQEERQRYEEMYEKRRRKIKRKKK